jgi:transcription antitermination factor NusA-like protein
LRALKTRQPKALRPVNGLQEKRNCWLRSTKKKAEVIVAEKWIQKAIKKPGALRSAMGVKAGEKIPAKKLATAAKAPGKMGQRARLAQTLSKLKK